MKFSRISNACAVLLVLLSLPATPQSKDEEADIIRIASGSRTLTLDPTRSVFTGSIETFGQLYSRLLRRDKDGKLHPALAESWEISEDGLDYTFHLREAGFSDGSPITAEDVAYSILRMRDDPEAAYKAAVSEVHRAWAEDEQTLRVQFLKPNAPFLESLEICFLGVVSKKDIETRGRAAAFAEIPVTSGPYRVVEWRRNDRVILEPNPYYWREGYPKNDGAELIEVIDVNTRMSMLRAGEVDAVRLVTLGLISDLADDPDYRVPEEPAMRVNIVLLNHDRPPFNDQRVREAAALAIDLNKMFQVMNRGRGSIANSVFPYQLLHYDPDFPSWDYDVERAKQLVEAAGAVGAEVVINFTAPDPDWEKAALILHAYWAEIGLNVTIRKMDQALYQQFLSDGDYNASVEWWYNETFDPDLAVKWAVCGTCGNRSFYSNYQNDRVDELVALGTSEMNPKKRIEIYREIDRIAFREVAQIPLYYTPWANAYSSSIEGLYFTPATQWTLEDAHHVR